MTEQTATCYELRVYVTVANFDGKPEYTAEEIAEGMQNALRRCPGGVDVQIIGSEVIED